MTRGLRTAGGFTLVEVMVGVLILSVALVAVLYGMNATLASIRLGRQAAEATNLLRWAGEEVKLIGFDDLHEADGEVWGNCAGTGYDVMLWVAEAMSSPNGVVDVKQVVLRAYRHPHEQHPVPIATWTFLVYREGI